MENIDKFNKPLYNLFGNRMSGNTSDSMYSHDEELETDLVSQLRDYKESQTEVYIRSLLNPEAHLSKIPGRIPIESTTAPLKWNFTINPNLNGKFCLIVDPFFHQGYLYQSSTVDGVGGSGTLTTLSFSQDVNIVDQWRLVSSSLILKYFGNFNQLSGYFVGATTSNVTAATQTTYLTFNNVEDLSNREVIRCIDGIKLVYTPMDERATEFSTQTTYTAGTHPCRWQYLFVVVGDSFPNSACIRADFFRNIEYTSTPSYKEYIPQNREQPCDLKLPIIKEPVTIAPKDFRGGRVERRRKESNPYADKLFDLAFGAMTNSLGNIGANLKLGKGMFMGGKF